MKRIVLTITLLTAGAALGATFSPTPYLADSGIDILTRQVANQTVERDLFDSPYATVVLGNIDVYENFPFLEARYFQVVSDPGWNRLVYGEIDKGLQAFDGAGTTVGPLRSPHGLATDDQGRVYVADTDNNRVVVFRAVTEFDRMTLVPSFVIPGLHQPYDVAFSDGGSPFVEGDDALYVANTGRNEVQRYALTHEGANLTSTLGALGSGPGEFAGPLAVTVAAHEGSGTPEIYVADAHNERLVHLQDRAGTLTWVGEKKHDLGAVTSLTSDHWGNLYATSPAHGVVKYTSDLKSVAGTWNVATHPRGFHVPRVTLTDHRRNTRRRMGEGHGVLVEQWDTGSGLRAIDLGVEILNPTLSPGAEPAVDLFLTDEADLTAELRDPATGAVVATHQGGRQAAGRQQIALRDDSENTVSWPAGTYRLTVRATSTYDEQRTAEKTITVKLAQSGNGDLPSHLTVLGNTPNPFNPSTTIRFAVPDGAHNDYQLNVYDTRGRLVRQLGQGSIAPGPHQVVWDGRDNEGGPVGSGVYLYRVAVGKQKVTGKMTLLK